jgi:hypothetical protein
LQPVREPYRYTKHDYKRKARHSNTKEDRRRRTRHKGENILSGRNHDFRRRYTLLQKNTPTVTSSWRGPMLPKREILKNPAGHYLDAGHPLK